MKHPSIPSSGLLECGCEVSESMTASKSKRRTSFETPSAR